MCAAEKIKVLMITPVFPYPLKSGGQVRVFNVIKHMSAFCDISVLSLIESHDLQFIDKVAPYCSRVETVLVGVYDNKIQKLRSALSPRNLRRTFKRLCKWIGGAPFHTCRFYDPDFEKKLIEMAVGGGFDIIHAVYAQFAPYLLTAKKANDGLATVLVDIDLAFVVTQREHSARKGIAKALLATDHKRVANCVANEWPEFDRIIAMSGTDKRKLLGLEPSLDVSVVPNGVDIEYFQPVPEQGTKAKTIAFLGGSLHYPNVDALNFFINESFPDIRRDVPEASLLVIGEFAPQALEVAKARGSSPLAEENIQFTGFVDDVRPHLRDCSMLIAPLRIGGGTRLKILEAMAMGVPVVTTSVGCEGIDAVHGRDMVVADTPKEFAEGVKKVLQNASFREELAVNARSVVERNYDWKRIADTLNDVYSEITAASTVSQRGESRAGYVVT